MARIRSFVAGQVNAKGPRSDVDAYVQSVVAADGTLYLYLYNYAANGPKVGDSPTQSLHFDLAAAKGFKTFLEETFGPL